MSYSVLELDALVRSVKVNSDSAYSFLLGAGSSITSGIPSASDCIWQWKHSIFVTNNPTLESLVSEPSLPAVRQRIDRWLSANGLCPPNGEDDYGYYIEKYLKIPDDRRKFFERWVRPARPHTGYRLMCLLAEADLIRTVWTTNFDGLVARGASDFNITPVEIGIDCSERVYRQASRGELVIASLHGDYRYDKLKNTKNELREQDETLRAALVESSRTTSLIVAGYSGRDRSVIDALREGIKAKGGVGRLFWCGYGDTPSKEVIELLDAGTAAGRECYFVPETSFDDLMNRIALHCLTGKQKERAVAIIGSADDLALPDSVPFRTPQGDATSVLKSNAWPIRLPSEMFQFELTEWPPERPFNWIREKTQGSKVVAAPLRKKVLAFGTLDGIREAFKGVLKEPIERIPLDERDLKFEDGVVVNLLSRALVQSIAARHSLMTNGRDLVWEPRAYKTERESANSYPVHKAVRLKLRRIGGESFMTFDPTVHVEGDVELLKDAIRAIRQRILGYQHNREYNTEINDWRGKLLTSGGPTDFDFPNNSAAFQFTVRSAPIFAEVTQRDKRPITLPDNVVRLVQHKGIIVPEPQLLFAPKRGPKPSQDSMPLRGLAENGPYDSGLAVLSADDRVRIGVVCAKAESPLLEAFLAEANRAHTPSRGDKEEYMVRYPGFEAAYRLPLELPERNGAAWQVLPELSNTANPKENAIQLSRNIRDAVTALAATGCRLVIVFTPQRWNDFRGYEDEAESFDVHDFVKAACVKQGIATQFLDQDTMSYPDKCRIWWWLSVALYAKSMRTPWVLDGLDPQSAYVGLGYAIDKHAARGQKIVLGCSHLYNSHGQGLQFRLTRIEDATFVGENPFLSFEDARRIGENIRMLFWQSRFELPKRVVLHKLTPFRRDEQLGFAAGLEGVEHLELIEVNDENTLRYIGSEMKSGKLQDAMFPVRRGTALRLTNKEALLWVHGATDAVKPNWTYFQGKRRIPGPVVIRRYAGSSDLAVLASEILGLSKMDWNSGDLYSRLPATVLSSKSIAKIGSLLDRFGETSYDYRLFM